MVIQKDVFWKAAIITLIVFSLGIWFGAYLEKSRLNNVRDSYKIIELEWQDAKLLGSYFLLLDTEFCPQVINENIKFAESVYQEGLKIDKYEKASKLLSREELIYEKRRYALLKLEFWKNSIYLKEKCNADYNNVVYFYLDDAPIKTGAQQEVIAQVLAELKDKYKLKIMLIPIPLDLDLSTVESIKNTYSITKSPTLLIDEKIKLEGVQSLEKLEKELNLK